MEEGKWWARCACHFSGRREKALPLFYRCSIVFMVCLGWRGGAELSFALSVPGRTPRPAGHGQCPTQQLAGSWGSSTRHHHSLLTPPAPPATAPPTDQGQRPQPAVRRGAPGCRGIYGVYIRYMGNIYRGYTYIGSLQIAPLMPHPPPRWAGGRPCDDARRTRRSSRLSASPSSLSVLC